LKANVALALFRYVFFKKQQFVYFCASNNIIRMAFHSCNKNTGGRSEFTPDRYDVRNSEAGQESAIPLG
jgi:hypothetical protein